MSSPLHVGVTFSAVRVSNPEDTLGRRPFIVQPRSFYQCTVFSLRIVVLSRTRTGPPPSMAQGPKQSVSGNVTRLLVLIRKDISSTKCSIADDEGREIWGRVKSYHLV